MDELIKHMELLGWHTTENGNITHDTIGVTCADWIAAIKSCIEVASA